MQHEDITLIAAADAAYLIPLEVMLTSARTKTHPRCRLEAIVISNSLNTSDIQWRVRGPRDTLRCVTPKIGAYDQLPIRDGDHVSAATYYRLYLGDVVTGETKRVVYLDSDLVVLRDLLQLWTADLKGRTVAAVRAFGISTFGCACSALATCGQSRTLPYFNAGVLLIDIARWQSQRIRERSLAFLRQHADSVRYWDQDALNYTLACDWQQLDVRWNRTSDFHVLKRTKGALPFSPKEIAALHDPYVVHFASGYKPWTHYRHPDKRLYDKYLALAGFPNERMTFWKALHRRLVPQKSN